MNSKDESKYYKLLSSLKHIDKDSLVIDIGANIN